MLLFFSKHVFWPPPDVPGLIWLSGIGSVCAEYCTEYCRHKVGKTLFLPEIPRL